MIAILHGSNEKTKFLFVFNKPIKTGELQKNINLRVDMYACNGTRSRYGKFSRLRKLYVEKQTFLNKFLANKA